MDGEAADRSFREYGVVESSRSLFPLAVEIFQRIEEAKKRRTERRPEAEEKSETALFSDDNGVISLSFPAFSLTLSLVSSPSPSSPKS